MQNLKKLIVAAFIATAGVATLPNLALAAGMEGPQRGFVHGADYYTYQMEQYHSEIARMNPEDRAKLVAMQDKLMQMEMDQASAQMKMDMEMENTKRDIHMFILSHSDRGQAGGH